MSLIPLKELAVIILVAVGLSAAITGSKIGFPIRFLYCRITWAISPVLRHTWGLVRCPYCNSFWGGAAVAFLAYGVSWWVVQAAFAALGIMRVTQAVLGGDGIAMVENFKAVFALPIANAVNGRKVGRIRLIEYPIVDVLCLTINQPPHELLAA